MSHAHSDPMKTPTLSDRAMLATPPPRIPRQNPTPQTPGLRSNCSSPDLANCEELPTHWLEYLPGDIDRLSENDAKRNLRYAIKHVKSLEEANTQISTQRSHYKFNFELLRSEQEERAKRLEVEERIWTKNSAILAHQLMHSTDEEHIYRQRHIKSKKRLAELTEDNRRLQHSIEHLKRALNSKTGLEETRTDTSPLLLGESASMQRIGGLSVLSDAAGLAQLREMDRPSSSDRPRSGPLLSPAAFCTKQTITPTNAGSVAKRRRTSVDTIGDGSDIEADDVLNKDTRLATPVMAIEGRRLTFNSSGSRSTKLIAPMTPHSPGQQKLEPSALD